MLGRRPTPSLGAGPVRRSLRVGARSVRQRDSDSGAGLMNYSRVRARARALLGPASPTWLRAERAEGVN